MGEIIFKIWYMIAVLPFIILTEANVKIVDFLKRKNIYHDWDMLHSVVLLLVIILIVIGLNSIFG